MGLQLWGRPAVCALSAGACGASLANLRRQCRSAPAGTGRAQPRAAGAFEQLLRLLRTLGLDLAARQQGRERGTAQRVLRVAGLCEVVRSRVNVRSDVE